MITIILTVSRETYLEKVITAIELLECKHEAVNLLCIVDGNDALYIKTRNLVNGTKFNERLTVRLDFPGESSRFDIQERRKRISAAHNQAKGLIKFSDGYVFSIEDDTIVPRLALQELLHIAMSNRAFGFAEGIELGRWGVPYIGAWQVDDIYEPKVITSVKNMYLVPNSEPVTKIDAGGLYCALIRADLYKQHTFSCENGLGPDINFGIENRQLGYENFISWQVPCTHLYNQMGIELKVTPRDDTKIVTLTKHDNTKWIVTY